jgi:hypothetical protein
VYTRTGQSLENSKDIYGKLRQTLIKELETKIHFFNSNLTNFNSDFIENEEKTDNLVFNLLKYLPV